MSDRKFTDFPFSDTTETVECRSTQKPFFPSFSCHPPIDEPRYQHRRLAASPPIPGSVSSSVASLPIKYPRKKEELILTDRDTASENSPEIEIVERDIIDSTLQVGSQCEWTGAGSEPQWDNPRSTKAYDHIDRHHGPKLKPLHFRGRAASNNQEQGQWLDRKDWVEAERVTPKFT